MVIDERNIEEKALPGRFMRWLITPEVTGNDRSSMCVIRVLAGQAVKPAHAHPEGDELVYIVHGTGRVMIDGKVTPVQEGCVIFFPQGSIHILQNTGDYRDEGGMLLYARGRHLDLQVLRGRQTAGLTPVRTDRQDGPPASGAFRMRVVFL